MKVLQNNVINIDKEARYVKKKCSACGSVLDISNGDILSETCDDNNVIIMKCPCCGSVIQLNKYFEGKKYSIEEYSEVVAKFTDELNNATIELTKIDMGYGKEYFNISAIGIVGTETMVSIVVYINEYAHGNWEKLLKENVYYRRFDFDIPSKILCKTFYDYAKYAQAMFDYVKSTLTNRPNVGFNGFVCRNLYEEYNSITACFRGGDFGSVVDIGDKNYKLNQAKNKEDKTFYTPDIKEGLEYVGDKIEDGSINIRNGLYAIACTIHNAALTDAETTKRHSVEVYGHVSYY